jgi:hypothetical protein
MANVSWGILAVVSGAVTFFIVGVVGEIAGHAIFPSPAGMDPTNMESIKANIGKLPVGAFVWLLVTWALAAFAGAWVAARLAASGKLAFGLAIGTLGLLGAVATMLMIPHPIWVWVLGVAEFLPAAYLGAKLAILRPSKVLASG